ncbi:MAG: MFS transporter [Myxococcales bacterium]|nr:MFS transporter [Myxococcales bacterium]
MHRLVALALLYFAQGLPFGFFSHAVPTLINREHPPEIAGLSSLLAIPWGLKFLWAPWVDRVEGGRLGRRRAIIFPLQALTVAALLLLGSLDVSSQRLTPLLFGFVLVSFLSATQDIAADGLTIDLLDASERERGGAIQTGAYRLGMIAGGGGMLYLADDVGFHAAFYLMALSVGASTLPLFFLREPPRARAVRAALTPAWSMLTSFAKREDFRAILLLLVSFKLGDALAAGMVTRWFVKQGLSTAEIALTRGLVGGVAAVGGAIAGAALATRLGRRRALVVCAALQSAAILLYAVLALGVKAPLPLGAYHAASVVEHAFGGAATAALFGRMMDLCRDESRATDYTVQACLLVLVTGVGLVASGFITGQIGLGGLFAIAAVVGLAAPFGAARRFPEERRA